MSFGEISEEMIEDGNPLISFRPVIGNPSERPLESN